MLIKCIIIHLVTFSNCWESLKVNKYQGNFEKDYWLRQKLRYGKNFIKLRNPHPIKFVYFIYNLKVQRLNVNGEVVFTTFFRYSLLRIQICLMARYKGIAINCYIQQKINKTCKYLRNICFIN